ncbi:antitoxin Xre-like helix-turn-helix domain-containing protein [Falsiroseomonas sp. CW058]|uniref:antitoxin Xre-like helix-turn-helix domain-containing protein n=1 Tax=Falsiroseomonas sp. CW058 TaxID=3388664 RepID=UPI003D319601
MAQSRPTPAPAGAPTPASVVSKAVIRAARHLGLTNAAVADILGLSEPTVSRLAAGTYALDPAGKPYELALLLIRLFRGLDAMVGGEEAPMRAWMRSPNLALAGIPADQVRSVSGLVEAVAYVDAARARL